MAHVSKSAADRLRTIQMRIATTNRYEAVVNGLGGFIEMHTDGSQYGFCPLDRSDAFNVFSRAPFVKGIEEHYPQ